VALRFEIKSLEKQNNELKLQCESQLNDLQNMTTIIETMQDRLSVLTKGNYVEQGNNTIKRYFIIINFKSILCPI
jgi:hypothetical protein